MYLNILQLLFMYMLIQVPGRLGDFRDLQASTTVHGLVTEKIHTVESRMKKGYRQR